MKRKASSGLDSPLPHSKRSRSSREPTKSSGSSASLAAQDPPCICRQVSKEFLSKSRMDWKIFGGEELPGAEVYYLPNMIDKDTSARWKLELEQLQTCSYLFVDGHTVVIHV